MISVIGHVDTSELEPCKSALKPAHHGSYAHFPGTGPLSKTCRDCRFCHGGGAHWFCGKHAELIRSLGLPKKQKPISRSAEACRYFEQAN